MSYIYIYCVFVGISIWNITAQKQSRLLTNDVDYQIHELQVKMQEFQVALAQKDIEIQSLNNTVNELKKSGLLYFLYTFHNNSVEFVILKYLWIPLV